MTPTDEYINFFKRFMGQKPKQRKLKRVFQWSRYLEWKDLSYEEKLSAKRFLLIPVFAYLIISALNQNFSLIVLLLVGYFLYKKFQIGKLKKK